MVQRNSAIWLYQSYNLEVCFVQRGIRLSARPTFPTGRRVALIGGRPSPRRFPAFHSREVFAMKKSAYCGASISVWYGRGAPGRRTAARLIWAFLALLEIAALGQIAKAQDSGLPASRAATPAPVQTAATAPDITVLSPAAPPVRRDSRGNGRHQHAA